MFCVHVHREVKKRWEWVHLSPLKTHTHNHTHQGRFLRNSHQSLGGSVVMPPEIWMPQTWETLEIYILLFKKQRSAMQWSLSLITDITLSPPSFSLKPFLLLLSWQIFTLPSEANCWHLFKKWQLCIFHDSKFHFHIKRDENTIFTSFNQGGDVYGLWHLKLSEV